MIVRFIAHAGFALQEDNHLLLIDPWFRDSTLENPLIEGINRKKTIEFQIPPTRERIEDYSPDIILLSHFHVHHAPFQDVRTLAENSEKGLILAHPDDYANKIVVNRFGDLTKVSIRPTKHQESFVCGPFSITALTHSVAGHLAWSVRTRSGHILHIADGAASTNFENNALDASWDDFDSLHPDIVFMSAGRNSLRMEDSEGRKIIESGCLSPIQAARLIQKIRPRVVSSIGNHNHSFKKNRIEFIPELPANEEEFRWALDWLAPDVKFVPIRAGYSFSIGESFQSDGRIDTYL